jgi:hypothetical protein
MTLRERFSQKLPWYSEKDNLKKSEECEKIADSYAIAFAIWLRKEDTPENAEKWFGYSDQDMLAEFKKEKGL